MKRALWLLSAAVLCARAEDAGVVQAAKTQVMAADFRASGRFVHVVGGTRTTYQFRTIGHWFPDGLRERYDLVGPDKQAERISLRMDVHGHVTAETIANLGAIKSQHAGSTPQKIDLPGIGLGYEDLVENQFFWAAQTTGTPAAMGSRTCYEVRTTPTRTESARYSAVSSCVEPTTGLPLRVTKTVRADAGSQAGQNVVFTANGVRQSGGMWLATEIKLQVAGQQDFTLVLIDHGTPKAKLTASDFDLRNPAEGDQ